MRQISHYFFELVGFDALDASIVEDDFDDFRTTAFWLFRGTPLHYLTVRPNNEGLFLGMIALDPHSFSRIEYLDCSSTILDDNSLALLRFFPLVRLDVSSTRVTNSGTSHLLAFTGTLRHLLVARNRGIDNESLRTFNDLGKLESVDLSDTNVTIRSVKRSPAPNSPVGAARCLALPGFVARSKILQPGLVSIVASKDLIDALVSISPNPRP